MQQPLVEILMATYNGAYYLAAQIDSIVGQSYPNWKLIIHDDGSDDGTIELAASYASRLPGHIVILSDSVICGGAKANFAHLMAHATADYIMLADQDDVWLPNKIQDSMRSLLEQETLCGIDTPLAVFTDLAVVDEHLNVVAPSFWAFQNIQPDRLTHSIQNLAVRNCITGCTLLMNKSALRACRPVLPVAVMHDWWCGLKVLQAKGKLIPLHEATVQYRQHSGNVVGARRWGWAGILHKIVQYRQYRGQLMANYMMARHFLPDFNVFSFFIRKIMLAIR
ncbi:family 2 glycosyl transferase [Pollutimonas subterranea]|uniref:Family 2 glycosyl transferase n=1 Tax=Pollutimonas subterranea TaxID=2045210 RepID=A0A2N4TZ74_9BURK|nr:glycosyltransferase family 2 protein [Pollutimonas subterranea]PLC48062.1 family 2 glycosyl transferase [Pollutimonas subterranea]